MIVRLNLERASPAVSNINYAGILPRSLQHAAAVGRQSFQMNAGRFVRAVLAPHYAEDAELGVRRFASSKQRFDLLVFIRSQPMITQNFWGDRKGRQGGHEGKF